MVRSEDITSLLSSVSDPEIPALSVMDMGIVRDIDISGDDVTVTITPTYSGCPAMDIIQKEIVETLQNAGYRNAKVKVSFAHAWTSDWISDVGKKKLNDSGITPPPKVEQILQQSVLEVKCPSCGSLHTKMVSEFGSTACKSYYYCEDCTTTFEYFKPL